MKHGSLQSQSWQLGFSDVRTDFWTTLARLWLPPSRVRDTGACVVALTWPFLFAVVIGVLLAQSSPCFGRNSSLVIRGALGRKMELNCCAEYVHRSCYDYDDAPEVWSGRDHVSCCLQLRSSFSWLISRYLDDWTFYDWMCFSHLTVKLPNWLTMQFHSRKTDSEYKSASFPKWVHRQLVRLLWVRACNQYWLQSHSFPPRTSYRCPWMTPKSYRFRLKVKPAPRRPRSLPDNHLHFHYHHQRWTSCKQISTLASQGLSFVSTATLGQAAEKQAG